MTKPLLEFGDWVYYQNDIWQIEKDHGNQVFRLGNRIAYCEAVPASHVTKVDIRELFGAASQAYGSLVGAYAADDSVQGEARIRLGKALGILKPNYRARARASQVSLQNLFKGKGATR